MTQTDSTAFAGVPSPLVESLVRRGFTELTPIQQAVLSGECATRNLRLSSQTGSGKTVALGFVIYSTLADAAPGQVRSLIITPTRELAHQVSKELTWLFGGCRNLSIDVMTGGTDLRAERRRLQNPPSILVGTPGRLLDHLNSGALDLSAATEVVLDEADQMLDMGFKDDLDALVAALPEQRRSHLVSATFPRAVQQLARAFQGEAHQLEGTTLGEANADIQHIAHLVMEEDRNAALLNVLLAHLGQRTLVFVQRRIDASVLAEKLNEVGLSSMPLSGDLPQAQRNRTLNAFKAGTIDILVATDVAARGLHVDDIELVIHADVPREAEVYTHRSGRTGRAGQKGTSLMLVVPRGRRRAEIMMKQAGLACQWVPLPTPKKIRRNLIKQTRRKVHEELAALKGSERFDPSQLEYATRLLEEHDPTQVVSLLLEMVQTPLPTEPREVSDAPLYSERDDRLPRTREHVPGRYGLGKPKGMGKKPFARPLPKRGKPGKPPTTGRTTHDFPN